MCATGQLQCIVIAFDPMGSFRPKNTHHLAVGAIRHLDLTPSSLVADWQPCFVLPKYKYRQAYSITRSSRRHWKPELVLPRWNLIPDAPWGLRLLVYDQRVWQAAFFNALPNFICQLNALSRSSPCLRINFPFIVSGMSACHDSAVHVTVTGIPGFRINDIRLGLGFTICNKQASTHCIFLMCCLVINCKKGRDSFRRCAHFLMR